ncbi:MAG: STAS domain-containing protein [Acidimicrobiia bacterium]|nr:STAS domain-containing protein [Acidimicrobiia bacterium]
MPGTVFNANISTRGPDAIIELSGDVNSGAQEGLEEAYRKVEGGDGRVLLDFTKTDYINSTGIALIVGLLGRARAEGREVVAYGLTAHYREVFQITRLSDFMTIYDDQRAASVAAK